MKQYILNLTSLLITLTGFMSCEVQGQYNTAKENKSLLWEITGNNLQKPVYIYGTMHLLCAQDAVLSKNLQQIIKGSDEIFLEIDMDDMGEMLNGLSKATMRNDTSLSDLYTNDEYERVKKFFDDHNMGFQLQMFSKIQPMLISALVYQVMLPCKESDGVEMSIIQLAHENDKPIKGLETAAFQASILENIPYTSQAKELLFSIDSADAGQTEADEMIKLYKEQDIDKLLEYTLKSDGGTIGEVQDVMINKRNKNWADRFSDISKNKQILIAVGAGHLAGSNGLLNLLKEKGFKIRPVENKLLAETEL